MIDLKWIKFKRYCAEKKKFKYQGEFLNASQNFFLLIRKNLFQNFETNRSYFFKQETIALPNAFKPYK